MNQFDTIGKADLRNACKAAGIKYSNMTNETMRAALKKHRAKNAPTEVVTQAPETMPVQPAASADPVVTTPPAAEAPAAPAPVDAKPKAAPAPKDSRNGITRPGPGKCRDVWDALDKLKAEGKELTFDVVRELAGKEMADATIRTQRQRWKTYHAEPAK